MREIRFHLIERIKTKTFLQGLKFYAGYGLRNIFQTGKCMVNLDSDDDI